MTHGKGMAPNQSPCLVSLFPLVVVGVQPKYDRLPFPSVTEVRRFCDALIKVTRWGQQRRSLPAVKGVIDLGGPLRVPPTVHVLQVHHQAVHIYQRHSRQGTLKAENNRRHTHTDLHSRKCQRDDVRGNLQKKKSLNRADSVL